MKIGYIILCHKEPELVARMASCVTKGTDNIVVIHVDKKVDIRQFDELLKDNERVVFVKNRVKVFWGGYNSIIATMRALKLAAEYECERYVLLQGCDYPIHSNAFIDDFFEKNKKVEFLKARNITNSKSKKDYMKCYGYHIFDNLDHASINFVSHIFKLFNRLGIKYRKGYYFYREENKKYEIYHGWAHFALTHECVEYILHFYETHPDFNKYFKHIFPPDETYIQTIIYNSDFALHTTEGRSSEKTDNLLNLTYFEYPKLVRVFEKREELEDIDCSKYLYIRKVKNNCEIMDWTDSLNAKEMHE